MTTGRVKWFDQVKGFGFISSDEGGPDAFVHYSQVRGQGHGRRNLEIGQEVQFRPEMTAKGLKAFDVVARCPEWR
jgi:CspA family cold shock protein